LIALAFRVGFYLLLLQSFASLPGGFCRLPALCLFAVLLFCRFAFFFVVAFFAICVCVCVPLYLFAIWVSPSLAR
jgi:hypothetical protein